MHQLPPTPDPNRPVLLEPSELPGVDALAGEPTTWTEIAAFAPSWLSSLVFHLCIVLLLAVWAERTAGPESGVPIIVSSSGEPRLEATTTLEEPAMLGELPSPTLEEPALAALDGAEVAPIHLGVMMPLAVGDSLEPGMNPVEGLPDDGLGTGAGDGLGQRISDVARRILVEKEGGNEHSEAAVRAALDWLARHQLEDGHWSFAHGEHPDCHGQCDHSGHVDSKFAATAIALLPFLGTGETHLKGQYRENVRRGLDFLIESIKTEGRTGSLWDPQGNMYGHGLASIVLCEAYAMSHDAKLRRSAQSVLDFIVEAQDKQGGGWRYQPGMPGDTSVLGWQLMALKSGHLADLRVPGLTFRRATLFLNHVAAEDGAAYGYANSEAGRPATTAIGLLCRMYLGWGRTNRTLRRGIQGLEKQGPSIDRQANSSNLYYNYYATQVMHHWGGASWKKWNTTMRDFLIETQAKQGHATGSWHFEGDHGSRSGGRLYCTAMSAMILEVYYRHLPIYGGRSVQP